MGRKEHYRDPDAPTPNSIVVATTAFVLDDDDFVLMLQRSDNGLWALPGGVMEIGETVAQCAERETLEETGYRVRVVGMVGVYSDPEHIIEYDDGEIRQQFNLCFRAQLVGGEMLTSEEAPRVAWLSGQDMEPTEMHESTRLRVLHGLARHVQPYLG